MTIFKRTLVAEDGIATIRTEALGTNAAQFGPYDQGALVALKANSAEQCAAGEEIYGQVMSIETATVNDGYSVGAVKMSHRIKAIAGANADTTALVVGDKVVADVQPALKGKDSTTQGANLGHVKKGTPSTFVWVVIAVDGDGSAGSTVLLQKA